MNKTDDNENKIRLFIFRAGCVLAALSIPLWFVMIGLDVGLRVPSHHALAVHSGVELFSVVVAACIFIVGWHVFDDSRPRASVLLACGFLAVAMFGAAYMLSRPGMPDFISPNSGQKAMMFWLFARVAAAASLLVYVLSPQEALATTRPLRYVYLTAALCLVSAVSWLILFYPDVFPLAFTFANELMSIRLLLELLVIALLLITLLTVWHRSRPIQAHNQSSFVLAVILLAISESFLLANSSAQYTDNFPGLLYKALAYIYLYRAMFLDSVRLPVERLQQAHRAIQAYAKQNEELLEHAPDAIVGVDQRGRIIFANSGLEKMLGYTREELIGESVEVLLPISTRVRHTQLREDYQSTPSGRPMASTKGLQGRHKDGRTIPVDIALGSHQGENGIQVTAFIRDISERQRMEDEMRHRATHDALTGLPNRVLMQDRLDLAMIHARRNHSGCALMMIDLDNFKDLNDGWGHSLGDKILVMVARRISRALREGDTVARFGGDEFVVLATGLNSPEAARAVAEKIMASMKNTFVSGNHQFHLSASIGVALFPQHAQDAETLLSHADIAMYKAKLMGRCAVCVFDESMGLHQQESQKLKGWLNEALERRQLQLYYQPQYNISDKSIVGFEALLRWHHPEMGWISPEVFIPVAEASGLIIPLTEWVLDTASEQIRVWSELGVPNRISVNVSALHFRQQNVLLATVRDVIAANGIPAQLLGLEITETALMEESETVMGTLHHLVSMGVHVSIDDFGTGYSSLASLQLFPLNTLKIDRSFMRDLHSNTKSAAIVSGLVNLAASLDLEVLAEGVENEEQLDVLRLSGCNSMQGWLMNPALPASKCTAILLGIQDAKSVNGH